MIEALIDWFQRRRDPLRSLSDKELLAQIAEAEANFDELIEHYAGGSIAGMNASARLQPLYRSAELRDLLPKREPTEIERKRVELMERNGETISMIARRGRPKRKRRRDPDKTSWLEIILEGVTGFLD